MSDTKKKKVPKKEAVPKSLGTPALVLGKKYKGERFSTITSAKKTTEAATLRREFAVAENAMSIEAYFTTQGIRDPVMKAAMKAYIPIRRATKAAFDDLFSKFSKGVTHVSKRVV